MRETEAGGDWMTRVWEGLGEVGEGFGRLVDPSRGRGGKDWEGIKRTGGGYV